MGLFKERAATPGAPEQERRVRFTKDTAFQDEVRRRVDEYFRTSGRHPRDCGSMYLKSALVLTAFFGSYLLLLLVAQAWWQVALAVLLVGLAATAVGLNIQHDGGHKAYSDRPWVNRLTAHTLDLVGGSSFLWNVKHSLLHHTYTNVVGHDTDIDAGFLARMAPHQKHHAVHRWQHYYVWLLYGFMTLRWHIQKEWWELITGRISAHRFSRPRGWSLFGFVAGKVVFLSLAFVIPMLLHPPGIVLLCYAGTGFVMGMALSLIFQISHCVDDAAFPLPSGSTGVIEKPWAIHQVESAVDYGRQSRAASWLLGGLNFQIEHHLFPRVSHVHYPAISQIVESTCKDFGIRYAEHRSLWSGVAEHYRFLRRLSVSTPNG